MFSIKDRRDYFSRTIKEVEHFKLVEGIVQIGSGVNGYNDEYSDIDLMVAVFNIKNAEITRNYVVEIIRGFNPSYIKEKQFTKDIFLVIAFLQNGLEFNISIVPTDFLSVKSPLWKVIVDKTGLVSETMHTENERFLSRPLKYNVGIDLAFEFVYCARSLEKELKRKNLIYALKMLEEMRDYTLIVQALNEEKKLHQFKAYGSLNPSFVERYLSTFTSEPTIENIRSSSEKITKLFISSVKQSTDYSMTPELEKLLPNSFFKMD
ncbi:aminoglycoside 6-adenylyltransferase [Mesobacillus jeotgali]|uniref:aminoglycoside 6-adenylyltransferase n=1 Tax=Mesobacillus jeotgali TaxID=129985 RepID=UPI00159200AC|nr:aminoglycoside 6-adenylyltransferase [Mesobacillus jeotgali]